MSGKTRITLKKKQFFTQYVYCYEEHYHRAKYLINFMIKFLMITLPILNDIFLPISNRKSFFFFYIKFKTLRFERK